MAVEKGDVVVLEYTLKLKDTGEVIETTSEELAKEAGIYNEKEKYGPAIIVVGEGKLLPGIEEALIGMEKDQEKELELPPEKAYGHRDPAKVKKYSLGEFRRAGIRNVRPGMVVEIGNKIGIVKTVSGGRVTVDFNHPYAGKTILAKVKVLDIIKSDNEKVKKLVERRIPDATVNVIDGTVEIKVPEKYMLSENIQLVKAMIVRDLLTFVPTVKVIRFIEEVKRPEENQKPSDENAEEGASEDST